MFILGLLQVHSWLKRWAAGLALSGLLLAGCAAPPVPSAVMPVTGGAMTSRRFQVREFAVVEQSVDNPSNAAFQERVILSVANQRDGLSLFQAQSPLQDLNQTLRPFGYQLRGNPHPPFGAYALYQDNSLVQPDIARFISTGFESVPGSDNFQLRFHTISGEVLTASRAGVQSETASLQTQNPAATDLVSAAGAGEPSNLFTWGGGKFQALEIDGQVIVNGENINQANGYDEVFSWRVIDDQPLYFYSQDGLTRLNYAGRDLPYVYDAVLHGGQGENALYNPGSSSQMIWFYALRDGLWYYVEAGLLE